MKWTLAWVLSLALLGTGVVAIADDGHDGGHDGEHHHSRSDSKTRADFALLNQPGGDVSVQCGAIGGGDEDDGCSTSRWPPAAPSERTTSSP